MRDILAIWIVFLIACVVFYPRETAIETRKIYDQFTAGWNEVAK